MPSRIPIVPIVVLFFLLIGCNTDNGLEPFDYARDTPAWLKERIDSMSTDTRRFYVGTKVYRYKWNWQFVYHISIPLSSCMYCEIYEQSGSRIQFSSDAMLQDFLNNRKDEIIVWESTSTL